jgi:hypothetical protein
MSCVFCQSHQPHKVCADCESKLSRRYIRKSDKLRALRRARIWDMPPSVFLAALDTIYETAERFKVSLADITSPCRQRHLARARQAAAFALRRKNYSHTEIGALLGGMVHSSVVLIMKDHGERLAREAA